MPPDNITISRPRRFSNIILLVITGLVAIIAGRWLWQFIVINQESQEFVFVPWAIVGALVASVVQEMLNPVFAAMALRSIGQTTSYWSQFMITLFSTSANSTVPIPAGIPIRVALQKKVLQIPYTKSANGLLLETIVGYGVTTLVAIVTTGVWLRVAITQVNILPTKQILYVAFTISLIMSLALFIVITKKRVTFTDIRQNAYQVLQARTLPLFGMVGIVAVSIGLALLRFNLILFSVGANSSQGALLAALLLSRLVGVLSFLPMGLGTRDVSLASLLVLIGVPAPEAIAASAIDRVVMTAPYLLGGVLATHVLGRKVLEINEGVEQLPDK